MPFDRAVKYSEHSIQLCKELSAFLRKSEEAELAHIQYQIDQCQDFIDAVRKLMHDSALSPNSLGKPEEIPLDILNEFVLKTSVWNSVLQHVEQKINTLRIQSAGIKNLLDNSIKPLTDTFMEMDVLLKSQSELGFDLQKKAKDAQSTAFKAQQELEKAKALSLEIAEAGSTQLLFFKSKEVDKSKQSKAVEKEAKAAEIARECEQIRSKAMEQYYQITLPTLYENMTLSEERRLQSVKKALQTVFGTHRTIRDSQMSLNNQLLEAINSLELDNDLSIFVDNFVSGVEDEHYISPKSLLDVIKSGRLAIKRGEAVQGWSFSYFCLTSRQKLYCFDKEEADQVQEIIDLKSCQVYSTDDSLFRKPHCFQLVFDNDKTPSQKDSKSKKENTPAPARAVYYLYADSEFDKLEWVQVLRKNCLCCTKCNPIPEFEIARVPNAVSRSNTIRSYLDKEPSSSFRASSLANLTSDGGLGSQKLLQEDTVQPRRNLKIWLSEAKDLMALGASKGSFVFCTMSLDDVKLARSNSVPAENPIWVEKIKFADMPTCINNLKIVLYSVSKNNSTPQELGFINIKIHSLQKGKKVEERHSIHSEKQQKSDVSPTLRLTYLYAVQQKLQKSTQDSFLEFATEFSFTCIKSIDESLGAKREELAKSLVHVLIAQDRDVEGIKALITSEIMAADNPQILFRGNSIATKTLDIYMKIVGHDYLFSTLHALLENFCKSEDSYEIDPSRVIAAQKQKMSAEEADKIVKKNYYRLLLNVEAISYAIFKSVDKIPTQGAKTNIPLYASFNSVQIWGRGQVHRNKPKLFNLISYHPKENSARMLTLVAKIMQNLANLTLFESKETHMIQFNQFISTNLSTMKGFIDKISIDGGKQQNSKKPRLDIRYEAAGLARFFLDNSKDILSKVAQLPPSTESPLVKLAPLLPQIESELAENEIVVDTVSPCTRKGSICSINSMSLPVPKDDELFRSESSFRLARTKTSHGMDRSQGNLSETPRRKLSLTPKMPSLGGLLSRNDSLAKSESNLMGSSSGLHRSISSAGISLKKSQRDLK